MASASVAASALGLALVVSGAGCKTRVPTPVPTHEPVVIDEAMQYRQDWSRSKAYFASGAVRTYRVRFPYNFQSTENASRYTYLLADFPALVYQTLRLPFTYLFYPPFSTRVEPGLRVNESHTGVPPLRAEPGGGAFGGVGASTAAGGAGAGAAGGSGGAGSGGTGTGGAGTGGTDGGGTGTGTGGTGAGDTGGTGVNGGAGTGAGQGTNGSRGTPNTPGQSERSPTGTPGGAGSGGTGTGGTGTGGTGTGGGTR